MTIRPRRTKARVLPKWPIIVQGTGGVTVTYANGRATISLDDDLAADIEAAILAEFGNLSELATTGVVIRNGEGSWTAGTSVSLGAAGEALRIKQATTLIEDVSGATEVATDLIPAGTFCLGVVTRIVTALGDSNSTTGYTVGDGSDADRWGVASAITAGTQTGQLANPATANPTGFFVSAQSVTLTAVGGNFDATGDIRVTAFYIEMDAPTS